MNSKKLKEFEKLSPFELKDILITVAKQNTTQIVVNAGRGNPNWIATTPRQAFFALGEFAIEESQRESTNQNLGFHVKKIDLYKRFQTYTEKNPHKEALTFLKNAIAYGIEQLNFDPDSWLFTLVSGVIGDYYPEPDRILKYPEKVIHTYLQKIMTNTQGTYDLFATEGGTAAMRHCFDSLITNKLLHKGDTIALGIPTFTPYLEMPTLPDYDLKTIAIVADPKNNWQYADAEIDKLKDPKIKAFFVVNPGNPTAQAMGEATINRLVALVKHHRPDLMILTDDVYGTFVKGFNSLAATMPANTLLVYSFSKHMGCTGWRLAVIALHQQNIFDAKIAQLPKKEKKLLNKRYASITTHPETLKFIDRMVADSRAVALNHTAGLSLPQQIQMTLFALFFLLDTNDTYIHETKQMIHTRLQKLYQALGIPLRNDPNNAEYYTIIDILDFAQRHYDKKFAEYLEETMHPLAFLFALAEKKSVILLNGGGFGASNWSVRISLANLEENDYTLIGQSMKELLQDFYNIYKS